MRLSPASRDLLHVLPPGAAGIAAQQAAHAAQLHPDDCNRALRSLRRHGLAINRQDGWLLTPKGADLLAALNALPV